MVLSFSKIATWRKCPRLYYLRYIEGLKVETDAITFGDKVHKLLSGEIQEAEPYIQARAKTLEKHLEDIEANIVAYEVPFSYELKNSIIIEGIFDAIGYVEDSEVVFEFKSGTNFDELQPRLYSIIAKKPVLVITADGVQGFITLTKEDEEQIKKEIYEVAKEIKKAELKNEYLPISGEHCKSCPDVLNCPLRKKIKENERIEDLIQEYDYIKALEQKIKEYLIEHMKDKEQIVIGDVVARKEIVSYKRIKSNVDKEELFKKYGLLAFEPNKKKLQKIAPELFEEHQRINFKITKLKR